MRKTIILVIVTFMAFSGYSQLEVGVFAGSSYYMGDLNPNTPFLQPELAYGVLARYNLNARWAVKLNAYQGVIKGDDEVANFLPSRELSFKSGINELGGTIEFNFLPYFNGSMKNYWTPYIFGGVALLYHRPQRDENDLRDFGTEGQYLPGNIPPELEIERPEYSYFVFSMPFGVGVKYSFSKRIAASLEWGMRKTFTDYLDDVSTTYYVDAQYVDPGTEGIETILYSDPNLDHNALMQRGNSKTNDWYSFAGLTITYYIDMKNKNKCSDFQEGL